MPRKTLMNKKAIIIANQDPLLAGVSKDIEHIQDFLKDIVGGAWNSDEIAVHINPSKLSLKVLLRAYKQSNYDYMMVFFTGHGGHKRQQTYVQINNHGDLIDQSSLENLCHKQINIYDCCRSEIEELKEEAQTRFSGEAYDSAISQTLNKMEARKLYENQIQIAKPQQLILYSCSLNEYSHDKSYGALYLTNLLKEARKFDTSKFHGKRFKLALEAHLDAEVRVKADNRDQQNPQNPDYQAVKFPQVDDYLVFSVNPMRYLYR